MKKTIEQVKALSIKQIIILVGSASLLSLFLIWWGFFKGKESTDNAYLKTNMTILAPKITGYIAEVKVHENEFVEAGKVIARIDDQDFKVRLQQAEAQLEFAKSRLKTLEGQKKLQQAHIKLSEAVVASAQANLEKAEKEYMRSSSLVEEGAVSRQFQEAATADRKNALAMSDKAQAEAEAAKSQLEIILAQLIEAQAQVKSAEAAVELAKIDLENTLIHAPLAGTIGNRSMQVGQLVRPGSTLAYLIPANEIWVEANFKETQIKEMVPGQRAVITVDGLGSRKFEGAVESLAPASGAEFSLLPPENATGNFTKIVRRIPVKIVFKDKNSTLLKPGMSSVVTVYTN